MSPNDHFSNGSSNITSPSLRSENLAPFIIIHFISIIGIIGNSFVIAIVAMINSMKTTTNILLVNVAIADIIMLVLTAIHMILGRTIPFDNSFLCKVIEPNTLSNVAILATSLSLTVLSIERYNALVKPMRISRRLTKGNVIFVIVGIWVVSMLMNIPILHHLVYDPVKHRCLPRNNNSSFLVSVGVIVMAMTIIPFVIIAFCYSQIISGLYFRNTIISCSQTSNPGLTREDLLAKRKLLKLLVTITIIFFIAFVPYGVVQISIFGLTGAKKYNQHIVNLASVVVYLLPVHSSINPFLYSMQSNNYRQGFKMLVKKLVCCVRNQRWTVSDTGSTNRQLPVVSYRQDQVEM